MWSFVLVGEELGKVTGDRSRTWAEVNEIRRPPAIEQARRQNQIRQNYHLHQNDSGCRVCWLENCNCILLQIRFFRTRLFSITEEGEVC